MDESKQKFEKWFDEHMYIGSKCIADPATKRRMFCAWIAAWQASRAAIEIELPSGATKDDERLSCETSHEGSFNLCLHHASNAIRSAGIKVKE